MDDSLEPVREWLAVFAKAVRARDYEGGRRLCDSGILGFGTVAGRAEGLDELTDRQWRPVWDRTEGFDFLYEHMHGAVDGGEFLDPDHRA